MEKLPKFGGFLDKIYQKVSEAKEISEDDWFKKLKKHHPENHDDIKEAIDYVKEKYKLDTITHDEGDGITLSFITDNKEIAKDSKLLELGGIDSDDIEDQIFGTGGFGFYFEIE